MNARQYLDQYLEEYGIVILPEMEAKESIHFILSLGYKPAATILDPWYNRGIGGVRDDYIQSILEIIDVIKNDTNHLYLWGFPEIVSNFINRIDKLLEFVTWLTQYMTL